MFGSAPSHTKYFFLAISSHKQKGRFTLHFDSHFVLCSCEGEFHGHFGFFSFKCTQ